MTDVVWAAIIGAVPALLVAVIPALVARARDKRAEARASARARLARLAWDRRRIRQLEYLIIRTPGLELPPPESPDPDMDTNADD